MSTLLLALLSLSPSSPRFDQIQQKTVHNAYQKKESIFEQLAVHGLRSVELDIHSEHLGGEVTAGEWAVYHVDFPLLDHSTCPDLSTCLAQVARFHALAPRHEPITLFLDLKSGFSPTHSARALDALLKRELGDALLEPDALVRRCPGASNVGAAIAQCGWPTVEELRGRVLIAATGGDLCQQSTPLAGYAIGGGRAAFLAPRLAGCQNNADAVFANITSGELRRSQARPGVITRVYDGWRGGLNDERSWQRAKLHGAQFLATDVVNAGARSWAKTVSASGAPYLLLDGAPIVDAGKSTAPSRVLAAP